MGIGLFGVEAVATVVLEEEAVEAEVLADVAGGVYWFVGQDGHGEIGEGGTDGFEGFDGAGVDVGVVELVDAVVAEEEGEGLVDVLFVVDVAGGVTERAADEHGDAIADVAGNDGLWELGFAEVGEGGVDGVAEVDAGVDEGAIKIEDDEARREAERHRAMVAAGGAGGRLRDTFGSLSEAGLGDYRVGKGGDVFDEPSECWIGEGSTETV